MTEEVCDMVPRQAQHWEMTYFCVCMDRSEKFHIDWSELLSTATDSCNLMICVTGELVRILQSKVATLGKDTEKSCQSPGIELCYTQ